jgi:excisionase family DNA binding protein
MPNHHTQPVQTESDTSGLNVPILSAERYAQSIGWSLAMVEEHMDRGELPSLIIGKHRLVNMEALRQRAILASTNATGQTGQLLLRQLDSKAEQPLLLSVDQTAQYLGIASKTIRKWLCSGSCPFKTVLLGARRLVRRADLEKFIDQLGDAPSEKPPAEISCDQNVKRGRGRPRNTLTPIH